MNEHDFPVNQSVADRPLGLQIIGTQRSGSNLLRVILDQSPEIASPHPPHLLITFAPLMERYGPMDAEGYRRLVSDVVDFVDANPVPWDGVVLDKDEIFSASVHYNLFEINRLVYERAALAKKARYWCCKSMANVHYAAELEAHAVIDKYIFLYRDGRDVAASFKKAIVGDKHTYFLAKQWRDDQEACIALQARLPAERFFALNYETLIAQPEQTVRSLCHFLGIAYRPEMLDFHTSHTSKITAAAGEMWANLEKPIIADNTGKFLKAFEGDDLEIFEMVAGETLRKLNYDVYTSMVNAQLVSPERIEFYKQENDRLKKESVVAARRSDLEKRAPQQILLDTIKSRQQAVVTI